MRKLSFPKRSKYGAVKTNGFASKKESKVILGLRLLAQSGQITDLKEQVRFELIPAQYGPDGKCLERACHYIADATYLENGRLVVLDAKGFRTKEYRIKRKLYLQRYGVPITEV